MKKYITFAVSFILLFLLFQVVSGMILTIIFTPNIEENWNLSGQSSQEVIMLGNHHYVPTLLIAFLAATIAYVIPQKIWKRR